MKRTKGTIVEKEGKFFLQVGTEMHELNANPFGDEKTLKANVGQSVQVVMTDPQIVAVLTKKVPTACYMPCFICYVPIDIFRNWLIDERIRAVNLKSFLEEGLISQEVYNQQMMAKG